jgi:hypothetical protein
MSEWTRYVNDIVDYIHTHSAVDYDTRRMSQSWAAISRRAIQRRAQLKRLRALTQTLAEDNVRMWQRVANMLHPSTL